MLNSNIMDIGSHSTTNGKAGAVSASQKTSSEGLVSDFLRELLSKLIDITGQGLVENQGESSGLKEPTKESKEGKTANQSDQPADKTVADMAISLLAYFFGSQDQISEFRDGSDWGEEKETSQSKGLSLQELTSLLKGLVSKGSLGKEKGFNTVLISNLLSNMGVQLTQKTAQSPMDESVPKTGETGEGELSLLTTLGQGSAQGSEMQGKGMIETEKVKSLKELQSSLIMRIENIEGKGPENEKGLPNGLDLLSQDGSLDDLKGLLSFKGVQDPEIVLDQEVMKNKKVIQNGENTERKTAALPQNSEISNVFGDSTGTERIFTNKLNVVENPQKPLEMALAQEQTFIVKKQSPSSVEVFFEPDGLGKLDLQLNLTNDRIHGQIMAHDSRGKELIENNLPQLLSELGKEGLQIGDLSVSLKNRGRDPNSATVAQAEPKEQTGMILSPEGISPVQDNHLVHIII